MQLQGSDGQSFQLDLVGYQFQDATEEWDANWLLVAVAMSGPAGRWEAVAPALLTIEARALATWLDSGWPGQTTEISFTEPNLTFEFSDPSHLRVYFELELRPPWARRTFVDDRDCWIEFDVRELDLKAAALALRAQLERFPVRLGFLTSR